MISPNTYRVVEEGPHTIWIDNFSKIMGCRIPSIDVGAWRNCLWTGIAVRKYNGTEPVSMELMQTEEGQVIAAMPNDPFEYVARLTTLWKANRAKGSYFAQSFAHKWNINNAPVKPVLHRVVDQRHHATLSGTNSRLLTLHPREIVAENIGSNIGLGRIMRTVYEDNKQHNGECKKYIAINADINIFERVMKVHTHHN